MRICFISSYPPNHARLSEYAQNLVKEIANKPTIDKMYLLVDKSAASEEATLNDNPKIEVLRVWKADDPLSILGVMRYVIKLRPQVVHFNMHYRSYGRSRLANFAGMSLIFLCRFLGFRVLAEVHHLAEKVELEKVNVKLSFLNRTGILLATKLMLSAQIVVVTVRSYVDYLKIRYGHMGVKYIPHGSVVNDCPLTDPEEKVILIFGSMGPIKGMPIMLKAFEELRNEKPNVKLVVAGSNHPSYPAFLDPYVKMHIPKVEFTGYVPEENLAQVFRMADVVVLPYLATTGTSGVFHLACGYGRPIVASDLPEIREILDEGASALLVPAGDVQALKDTILKVLSDEKLATRMIEQNLRFAHGESWGTVAEMYEKAYLELLNR